MEDRDLDALLDDYGLLDRLELMPRMGYVLIGEARPESIAAHLFSATFLVMVLGRALVKAGETLDLAAAYEMSLLHEVGEIFLGDLALDAKQALGVDVKTAAERRTGTVFLERIDHDLAVRYNRYLDGDSPEARLVVDCDRVQFLVKAALYRAQGNRRAADFLRREKYSFHFPLCARLAERVFARLAAAGES